MDRLRTPLLIVAIVLMLLVVLIETGTALPGVLSTPPIPMTGYSSLPPDLQAGVNKINSEQPGALDKLGQQQRPPGLSIPVMALVDGIMLFTVALMGLALIIPASIQGKVQGIATLIFSLLLIILALVLIFAAVAALILMISLLLAVPFGTIAYLIIFGTFNRGGADIALGLTMFLKFGFAVCLFLAQQRFLQSKGLVLLVFTSLLCNVIISFLLGLVPGFLASITDAIAAIIVGIIAVIWCVFLLVGAIISIVKVLRVDRSLPSLSSLPGKAIER